MTWFLDLRTDAVGGGVAQEVAVYDDDVLLTAATLDNFRNAVRNQDIIFVTHGFNVDRQKGRATLANWQAWQSLPASVLYVAVLWPGDSAWLPVIDYPIEGNEAIASGNLLGDFISKTFAQAASLSFVSHSLGARVVLQTIRRLGPDQAIRYLLLMAGAIDDDCLTAEYNDVAGQISSIDVLSSYHDEVLALAFPAGNLASGIITRGSPYWHAALGRGGPPDTLRGKIQAGWQIPDAWDYGHHDYLPQSPPEAAPLPLQMMPPEGADPPVWGNFAEWQAAWSAAINSTRYRSASPGV